MSYSTYMLTCYCYTSYTRFLPVLDEPVIFAVLSAVANHQHAVVKLRRATIRLGVNS